MKNFIKNKKVIITFISCLVVIALVFIGVTAMKMVAKNSSIGTDAAKKFALLDAGVKEKNVNKMDVKFEYKDSTYVYKVKFDTNKKDYNYYVKASNGIILEKKIIKKKKPTKKKDKKKTKKSTGKNSKKTKKKSKSSSDSKKIKETTKKVKSNKDDEEKEEEAQVIGMDEAKSIAINSAGESSAEVVFTLARLDGNDTYHFQFYNGKMEYNYSIDAISGSVLSGYSINREGSDTENNE